MQILCCCMHFFAIQCLFYCMAQVSLAYVMNNVLHVVVPFLLCRDQQGNITILLLPLIMVQKVM